VCFVAFNCRFEIDKLTNILLW